MKKSMKVKLLIASFFALFLHLAVYAQTWQLVSPKYATTDAIVAGFVVDAATYGNGTTDATSHIQGLLNQLDNYTGDANHGGGVVYLPEGRYKISGRLNIPKGITLRGDWKKPVKGQPVVGTIIQVYADRGADLDAQGRANSFITMESGAAVMDLAFWYPEQDPNNIVPYPPTIQFGKPNYFGNEFCNAKNITLVNSYYGIIFYQGGGTCPTINGVYGTPLKQGVEIDRIVDIGRIEHCDFSPKYWAGSGLAGSPSISNTTYTNWIYNNGTGIVMRRNDWSYTCYLTVEGYNKGFHALQSRQMDGGGYATPNGHNYGFDLKNCKYGVYYESRAGEGCMFTEVKTAGCEFGIYFTGNAGGVAQLLKCELSATKCAIFTDKNASTKITLQESTIKADLI